MANGRMITLDLSSKDISHKMMSSSRIRGFGPERLDFTCKALIKTFDRLRFTSTFHWTWAFSACLSFSMTSSATPWPLSFQLEGRKGSNVRDSEKRNVPDIEDWKKIRGTLPIEVGLGLEPDSALRIRTSGTAIPRSTIKLSYHPKHHEDSVMKSSLK